MNREELVPCDSVEDGVAFQPGKDAADADEVGDDTDFDGPTYY